MTQSQIKCFLAVSETLSFSSAAQQLYISQPAVSRQIALLEEELGFALFDRTRKETSLTPAGKLMCTFLKESRTGYLSVLNEIRQLNSGNTGDLRIGCGFDWDMSSILTAVHESFEIKYPDVTVSWEGRYFDGLIPSLSRGEIDLFFSLSHILPGKSGLFTRPVTSIKNILLFSARHPAAKKKNLTLLDFADCTFYIPTCSGEKSMFMNVSIQCSKYGFIPNIVTASDIPAILMYIQSGTGVMLTSEWTMSKTNPLFSYITLNNETSVCLSCLDDDRNAAKKLFINEVQHYYRQLILDSSAPRRAEDRKR